MPIIRKRLEDLPPRTKGDIARLRSTKDEDIDCSDIPELDEEFLKHAKILRRPRLETVTLNANQTVVEWFKSQDEDFRILMSEALYAYMVDHQRQQPEEPLKAVGK